MKRAAINAEEIRKQLQADKISFYMDEHSESDSGSEFSSAESEITRDSSSETTNHN